MIITGFIVGIIILLCIIGLILYTYLFTDKVINLDIATIVSIILALFSIFISMMFYFKTTETSNQFYITSNDHMSKQSELLGRIEERFGAQLKSVEKQLISIQGLNRKYEDTYEELDEEITNKYELNKKLLESENITEEEKKRLLSELESKNEIILKLKEQAKKTSDQINKSIFDITYTKFGPIINMENKSRIYEHRFLEFLYDLTAQVELFIDNKLRERIRSYTSINGWFNNDDIKGMIINELSNWLITRPQMPKKKNKNYILREAKKFIDNISNSTND